MRRALARTAAIGFLVALVGVYLASVDGFGWPGWSLWAAIGIASACLVTAIALGGKQAIADFDEATIVSVVGTVTGKAIDSHGTTTGLNVRVTDARLGRFNTVVMETTDFPIDQISKGTMVSLQMWSNVKNSAWITGIIR